MAIVLGISAYYHDSAAALVIDGNIIAAISQERISRIKNDSTIPIEAAKSVLSFARIKPEDVDLVVFYENPFNKLERVLVNLLRTFPRSYRQFPRAISSQIGSKIWVKDTLSERLKIKREKVSFTTHHKSHAASAFFCSPFRESAVLVVDGVGEEDTTSIWYGNGQNLKFIQSIPFPHSIGLLYAGLTAYLGFEVNNGEYKVMGLSAYGSAKYLDEFSKIINIENDESFTLNLKYFSYFTDTETGFGPALEKLLGPKRNKNKPWNLNSEEDKRYADIAATLQQVTEDILKRLANRALKITGSENLCMAGGVALNVVANGKIAMQIGKNHLFIQPAAGDAGGALGSAIIGSIELGDKRPTPLKNCALGLPIETDKVKKMATDLGLSTKLLSDPAQTISEKIEANEIVCFLHGRFEWGPRSLGQRSILANPKLEETKDELNLNIKKRENFRPFAPVILGDHMDKHFEGQPDLMTPFMSTVHHVKKNKVEQLKAVTHIDRTSRVQSVDENNSKLLNNILHCVNKKTGLPIVLNTSLNGPNEPIVASAQDALLFFMRHPVETMIVEDQMISKKGL
ncbi:MAG: carbamoyltransferase N-terminal domain-containing protein [Leptospirales bacterium]